MNQVADFPISEINQRIGRADVLICSASFELRSLSIINSLNLRNFSFAFIARNVNNSYNKANFERAVGIVSAAGCRFETLALDSDHPISTADAMLAGFSRGAIGAARSIVVDVTTFTRESLAILVLILDRMASAGCSIKYLYTPAASYGGDGPCWLSRGVRTVRSIVGYSGSIIPSRPNHLILLPGYEFERAHEIAYSYEPNMISIGTVPAKESYQNDYFVRQQEFVSRLARSFSSGRVRTFEFSAKSPLITRDAVLGVAEQFRDCNTIVIPLNSKPSVIGACMACLKRRDIQMGYAKPEHYNTDLYSTASLVVQAFETTMAG